MRNSGWASGVCSDELARTGRTSSLRGSLAQDGLALNLALGREDDSCLAGYACVVLDTSVLGEVEYGLLAHLRGVQVKVGDDQLVAERLRLGHDFAGRLGDQGAADHADPLLGPRLRGGDDVAGVLVCGRLRDQIGRAACRDRVCQYV